VIVMGHATATPGAACWTGVPADHVDLFVPAGTPGLPPVLAKPATDAVNAWVCEGVTCLQPVDTPEKLRESLGLRRIPAAR
jgi:uncharacterized protein YyaL (SSP411 family)